MHLIVTTSWRQSLIDTLIAPQCFHREAKTFAKINAKTSKHRIPLLSLWFNHFKLNQQRFQVLYVCVTVSSVPSRFLGAVAVLIIRMIFTRQRRPAMKTTPCLTLKWRLLAGVTRPCLSSASHFFGLRISPSWSEIRSLRRISCRSSDVGKFLGRLGKIEGFFISNPCKRCCLYFKQFRIFLLIIWAIYVTCPLEAYHWLRSSPVLQG